MGADGLFGELAFARTGKFLSKNGRSDFNHYIDINSISATGKPRRYLMHQALYMRINSGRETLEMRNLS